jgi:soluble lytic murein transglycosylase-like protein
MASPKENRERYMPLIQATESEYNLPPNLLLQLLQQESGFADDIISGKRLSKAGARGFGQFMPDTANTMAERLGYNEEERWKPEAQIKMSGALLSELLQKYSRDSSPYVKQNALVLAYAEYNAGSNSTKFKQALKLAREGKEFASALPIETQGYIKSVTNWTGQVSTKANKYSSSTDKLFKNFGSLTVPLDRLTKLPKGKTDFMAKFLIEIAKGNIIKP